MNGNLNRVSASYKEQKYPIVSHLGGAPKWGLGEILEEAENEDYDASARSFIHQSKKLTSLLESSTLQIRPTYLDQDPKDIYRDREGTVMMRVNCRTDTEEAERSSEFMSKQYSSATDSTH